MLKVDSNDISSLLRTAVVLIEERRFAQARKCLDKATYLVSKLEHSPSKKTWLDRIKTQQNKLSLLLPCHTHQLPNELLVRIAQFLDVGDRLTMSQICNPWREIILTRCLWTELLITIKQGPHTATTLTAKQATKWFNHIRIGAQKSNHSLESVRFKGPFPEQLLVEVLSILRRSAHSLTTIELPALDQERCYTLLYRYCPNLTTLQVRFAPLVPITGTSALTLKVPLVKDSPDPVEHPFLLEHFKGDDEKQHPGLARHFCCLRVLDKYNPYTADTQRLVPVPGQVQMPIEVQYEEPWSRIADCLEEWIVGPHWPSSEILAAKAESERHLRYYERELPVKLIFSKLVKLEGFRLDRNLRFQFPELRELLSLKLGQGHDHDFWSEELGRILQTSPLLRKAEVKLYDRQSVQNDWVMAFRGLQNLEELHLDISANPDIVLLLLLPRGTVDGMAQAKIDFPLPKVQRLALSGWIPNAMRLIKILAMRLRLKDGASLFEAREWALHRLEPVAHHMRSAAFSPEQRREAGPAWPHLTTAEEAPTLKVEISKRCCSLETIELRQLREMPVQYERTLREMVPNVELKYAERDSLIGGFTSSQYPAL